MFYDKMFYSDADRIRLDDFTLVQKLLSERKVLVFDKGEGDIHRYTVYLYRTIKNEDGTDIKFGKYYISSASPFSAYGMFRTIGLGKYDVSDSEVTIEKQQKNYGKIISANKLPFSVLFAIAVSYYAYRIGYT